MIYEVIWTKLLTLTFGVSAFAVAAVLMAFMGGLALGSFLLGRIIDVRTDHIRFYGFLELGIGIYALLLPILLHFSGGLFVIIFRQLKPEFFAMSLIRLVFSVLLLLIPTVMMGGTLPIMSAFLTRTVETAGARTALLYGINTLGATCGCLAAGFILIPALGLNLTTWFASCINISIFMVAFGLHVKLPESPYKHPEPITDEGSREVYTHRVLIFTAAAIGLSGFTAMIYETIWTRVLSMIIGTTVYAFTTMLAAFLTGLVLGSLIYAKWPPKRPLLLFAAAQFSIGAYVLVGMPWFDHFPFAFLQIFDWTNQNWTLFQFLRFSMLFIIMLIPTTFFGLSLPLAVQISIQKLSETGKTVGSTVGFNTVGAILGSFFGGFIFIPFLGFQLGMFVAALINIFIGLVLFGLNHELDWTKRLSLGIAGMSLVLIAVLLLSPWNVHYLNSGAYIYAHDYNQIESTKRLKSVLNTYQVLYYKEGITATVAVIRSPRGTYSLTIEGKTDASTGKNADMSTQILLAHLPTLFVDNPKTALNIGLGSGVSLGSLLKYPVEEVDVVEISKAVVEASYYFQEYNYNALENPRTNLIIGDGRHHLKRSTKKYDLIISQPSNPWIAGVSNLFTKEYYHLMSQSLQPEGVVCQWIPSYHMSQKMLATICKTFKQEFSSISLWTSSVVGDLFLIGSNKKLELDYQQFLERIHRPKIAEDLKRIGFSDPSMLASTFKFGTKSLNQFINEFKDLPANTDMHPVIEYMTPKFLLNQKVARDFNQRSDLTGDLSQILQIIDFTNVNNKQKFKSVLKELSDDAPNQ